MNQQVVDYKAVLKRYYLYVFPAYFVFLVLCLFFRLSFSILLFVSLGYVWCLALCVPGILEKMKESKLRFSFFSMIVRLNDVIQEKIPIKNNRLLSSLGRSVQPLVFSILMSTVSDEPLFLWTILGVLSFELYYSLVVFSRFNYKL